MKKFRFYHFILALVLVLGLALSAVAENYDAGTMRLLRHEGQVEIYDVSGEPRFIMDNVRFSSGESMRTGADGKASVGLDDSKIVTLDANSRVDFIREADHIRLNLSEGTLFLDVQDKLDENEGLDIQTTTMTVGIRGTVVFLSIEPDPDNPGQFITTLGVLEGTADVTYTDANGTNRRIPVEAGKTAKVTGRQGDEGKNAVAVDARISGITVQDVHGFVTDQVMSDPDLVSRVSGNPTVTAVISGQDPDTVDEENPWPADGDWSWSGKVTLVAQSASKLYDRTPLTRPSDVLVYGLPGDFNIKVSASGSQTNAGSSANTVSSFTITNAKGENVTSHFTNVEKVNGTLVVDPAPLVVWTGSAEKYYDGEPLTCEEAQLKTVPGHSAEDPDWLNTSLVTQTALGSETMVAVSGRTYVQGTNPLTGETQQLELKAGQSLSVCLHEEEQGQSLEFQITTLTEEELPEDVLRLYADNPDLLAQACVDTGWNPDVIAGLIAGLPPMDTVNVTHAGLKVAEENKSSLMTDSTNVRINIDSEITNYASRPLGGDEANFTPIILDPSIVITATGSQTEIGESLNTYTIDWGKVDRNNYVLREDLGTLTVLGQKEEPVVVTAGSASKVYDGEELTNRSYTVRGLPEGYTARVSVRGSITEAGEASNQISSLQILDPDGNDAADQFKTIRRVSGTLTVEPLKLSISLGGSVSVPYSGSPYVPNPVMTYDNGSHAGETVTGSRLAFVRQPDRYLASSSDAPRSGAKSGSDMAFRFTLFTNDTVDLTLTAIPAEAGSYTFKGAVSSSTASVTCPSLDFSSEPVTVEPVELTITTGSAEKIYDGQPLTSEEVTVTGLVGGDSITVVPAGTQTDAGESNNTFTVDWGDVNKDNYIVMENPGTLTVTKRSLLLASQDGEKTYDGTALVNETVTEGGDGFAEGEGAVYEVTGQQTDAGSSVNSFDYTLNEGTNAANYDITKTEGVLTVTPMDIVIDLGGGDLEYGTDNDPIIHINCGGLTLEGDSIFVDDHMEVYFSALTAVEEEVFFCISGYPRGGDHAKTYALNPYGLEISGNPANFTISWTNDTVTVNPMKITVTMLSESKVYDGESGPVSSTLSYSPVPYDPDVTIELDTSNLKSDADVYDYQVSISAAGHEGDYIFDTDGVGQLTITPAPLTFGCGGESIQFGSEAHHSMYVDCGNGKVETEASSLGSGTYQASFDLLGPDQAVLTVSGFPESEDIKATDYPLIATWEMTSGSKSNYAEPVFENTILSVSKKPITIETSPGHTKTYDGQPFSLESEYITVSDDPYGQIQYREIGTTGKDVDTYENQYQIDYNDADPDNYEITSILGTMTICPKELTVTTGSATRSYTGMPLTNSEADLSGLVDGETAAIKTTGSQKKAGSSENTYEITWDNAKESNYTITEKLGTLVVERLNVTIEAGSDSKTYDGTPLTCDQWTFVNDVVIFPDKVSFIVTGSQTDPGESENICSLDEENSPDAGNYNFTFIPGTLTVYPE